MAYWRAFYHLVWATKDRESSIGDDEERLIGRSFKLTLEDLDIVPHAVGFMPDHVHLAVSIPPRLAVSEVVRRLKGGSSHAMNHRRTNDLKPFAWQSEYGVLTFGERALPDVADYVRNQKQRHASSTTNRVLERTTESNTADLA
jgi:putative transposase